MLCFLHDKAWGNIDKFNKLNKQQNKIQYK